MVKRKHKILKGRKNMKGGNLEIPLLSEKQSEIPSNNVSTKKIGGKKIFGGGFSN